MSKIENRVPITTRGDLVRGGTGGVLERFTAVTDNRVVAGDGTDVVLKQIDDPAFFTSGAIGTTSVVGASYAIAYMSDNSAAAMADNTSTVLSGGDPASVSLPAGTYMASFGADIRIAYSTIPTTARGFVVLYNNTDAADLGNAINSGLLGSVYTAGSDIRSSMSGGFTFTLAGTKTVVVKAVIDTNGGADVVRSADKGWAIIHRVS